MKKTYKIDVDCANCANKMEEATKDARRQGRSGEFHGSQDESRV